METQFNVVTSKRLQVPHILGSLSQLQRLSISHCVFQSQAGDAPDFEPLQRLRQMRCAAFWRNRVLGQHTGQVDVILKAEPLTTPQH